jgi:hypothetical protein
VLACRREPKDAAYQGLVFLTRHRQPWVRYTLRESKDEAGKKIASGVVDDAIAKSTAKLLTNIGIERPGLSFYALRHTTAIARTRETAPDDYNSIAMSVSLRLRKITTWAQSAP